MRYFNADEKKNYMQAINKMLKPIGKNIFDCEVPTMSKIVKTKNHIIDIKDLLCVSAFQGTIILYYRNRESGIKITFESLTEQNELMEKINKILLGE